MPPAQMPEIAAALSQGLQTLSADQEVTFTQYTRTVLPLDGFVFWVINDILGPNNAVTTNAPTIVAKGSLHIASTRQQTATGSATTNKVIFTTSQPLHQGIEQTNPPTLYIGQYRDLQFSFAAFDNYYHQAGLWHYVGDAIYSDMQTQIISNAGQLTLDNVLSNSMPLWLFLSNYVPSAPAYGYASPVQFYPSFLVPTNLVPPYAAVDVERSDSIAGAAYLDPVSSDFQLTRDTVKVTTYGLRNEEARRLILAVQQRSLDYGEFGLLNVPTVTDEKQNQVELGVLAMRKGITFEISYLQGALRSIARQMLLSAIPSFRPGPLEI